MLYYRVLGEVEWQLVAGGNMVYDEKKYEEKDFTLAWNRYQMFIGRMARRLRDERPMSGCVSPLSDMVDFANVRIERCDDKGEVEIISAVTFSPDGKVESVTGFAGRDTELKL